MKYLAKSIPRKGKPKNGDHFRFYEDEEVLIAVMADGVGGNACDWKASEQACEDLLYNYQSEYRELGVKEGIALSLRKTYARIYWTRGDCEGMLTTLIALVVDKSRSEYFYFGVGDSLILKFENGEIVELTPETAFQTPLDLLPGMVRSGGLLNPHTAFALMTDGIYANRRGYKEELALVLHSENWEDKFEQLMQLHLLTQFDDMTLMLLRGV